MAAIASLARAILFVREREMVWAILVVDTELPVRELGEISAGSIPIGAPALQPRCSRPRWRFSGAMLRTSREYGERQRHRSNACSTSVALV